MSKPTEFEASLYGRPATIKTKRSLFQNHVKPYVAGTAPPVRQIDQACKSWVQDQLSIGTIKGCLVLLAEYMKFTHGYILDKRRINNDYFYSLAKPPAKLKVWTKEQIKWALQWASENDPDLHQLMIVALGTAARRGEIFGLKWPEIDFINSTIDIVRSRDISSGEIGPTKTRQIRQIQMSDAVNKILESLYIVGDEGFIFPNYFDPNNKLATLSLHANVPFITFHGLRHTAATMMFEANMPVKAISQMLGHAKLTTTLDTYVGCTTKKLDLDSLYE